MSEQELKTNEHMLMMCNNYVLSVKAEEDDILFVIQGSDMKIENRDLLNILELWATVIKIQPKDKHFKRCHNTL